MNSENKAAQGIDYDICISMSDEEISHDDFKILIEAMHNNQCNEAWNVKTAFSMSKKDFSTLANTYHILDSEGNPLVFYRTGTPSAIGAGAILVYGNPGDFPVKMGDRLHIWTSGDPKDTIIELSYEGCDPGDADCDAICSYEDNHVCDPKCYNNNAQENVQCDIDCVDKNGNRIIDAGDIDGICDKDCYNNDLDPKRAYDPDCIDIYNNDSICDPDSQGIRDDRCDTDCAQQNHICDFDCNGTVYAGNPSGLKDKDCYECDSECNGFCSYDCSELDEDEDCPDGFNGWFDLTACCGNGKCESGESCKLCDKDCPHNTLVTPPILTCSDFNKGPQDNFFCCPEASTADVYGCANTTMNKPENESCPCGVECAAGLSCNGPADDKHCCSAGKIWNGTECKLGGEVLIVALKANLASVYSAADITSIENRIKNEFIPALGGDGLGATFLYLDEQETADLAPGGVKVTSPNDWSNIDSVLDVLIPKMKSKYLIIIGGYNDFPQTPAGSTAGSDDPYGDIDGDGNYIPEIPVGRIPAPNGGDVNVILKTLDTAINLHKAGGIALDTHVSPIMGSPSIGCGGYDAKDWNSGKCTCQAVWGDSPCNSVCGTLELSSTTGKDFVILLAHGPGPSSSDLLIGGGIKNNGANTATASDLLGVDVSDALWMVMACGGAHLKLKSTTANSIAMTYLKHGGAIFIGSSDNNYGSMGSCSVPGGDCCVGSLYTEIAARYNVGTRVGDAYKEGKNAYFNYPSTHSCSCGGGHKYQYHINYLLGDPTLKIKSKW